MRIRHLRIESFPIAFRTRFRHTQAERGRAENIVLRIETAEGHSGIGEGCPRTYVTGETVPGARRFLEAHGAEFCRSIDSVSDIGAWQSAHAGLVDANPAAFCALELAALDALARRAGVCVETLLGLPESGDPMRYSAVLGLDGLAGTARRVLRYRLAGFRDFKLKLSGDPRRDNGAIRAYRWLAPKGARLRADANNAWDRAEDCIAHIEALNAPLCAVEEPLAPRDLEGCRTIAAATQLPIILDESLTTSRDLHALDADADRWIANLRVSKLGGLLRSIEVAQAARAMGMPVVIGAQVGETSVLTRAGIALARAVGGRPWAMEGAFGTRLLRRDPCNPSLAFGWGGRLDPAAALGRGSRGLGLRFVGAG